MTQVPAPRFDHLLAMTDDHGTFEHACFAEPRPEHGYCTDDMARVLVVASREREPSPAVQWLVRHALQFLESAQTADGAYRNRMDATGAWTDGPTVEDCWGRAMWGLGTAVARSELSGVRGSALAQFERAERRRSPWPRAMAFAAVGAAEVLTAVPGHDAALRLLVDYAATAGPLENDPDWPWPEPRLRYANAVLAEARIVTGRVIGDAVLLEQGLRMLQWLVGLETAAGHLSPCPVAGWERGDSGPAYDQQPIEVSTLADACARAAEGDPSEIWSDGLQATVAWFAGNNDLGQVMWNPATGGGFDGLHVDGINANQGAESTLALLSTLQHARRLTLTTA